MTFEYAPITKGLMLGVAATSIFAGIFDVKHYLHLQLVPHITRHHQYWRLFAHHLACAGSSDLLLTELLLYNASVHIERAFGSVKFASFLLIVLMLNTLGTFVAQLILHLFPVVGNMSNYIPPGPTAVAFSIIYQYSRLVPSVYEFKIFGLAMTDKIWVYATALQVSCF
ncbi:hypothetical protein NM688_g8099 [Phlebia brevispora]|uniref:Uncharacterized protein n=1 Tax=Phlebia brevispora TaxID=194682 RepID=A0ACC1RXC4_9APHY|nr:hypothetical protein NM688_g8099 [Phlebia brevispora]